MSRDVAEPISSDPSLVERVVRHEQPPEVADPAAHARLVGLVHGALTELAVLAARVVIATAPNRFNDVSNFDWCIVGVDGEIHECDTYATTRAQWSAAIAAAPAAVRQASEVLLRLERAGLRQLFVRAYDLPLQDEFLALVVQDGLWFVYASSNLSGREHVFRARADRLEYFGECVARSDDELLDGHGLSVETVG